ncbi:3-deoxy-manno-octulosonate cytidylyltransferase (CMP-KDO synthetase) [Sphingomonas zeicaulis]|uniref:3-deoxy-manno-octulosonate cytidylyltransferase n=1 Tax=Sphingomonas zeicaulis TaxID=1632740 RepID=UPI003D21C16C
MAQAAVSIVIPARFASSRYPGKPLAAIRGATGIAKSLIQRSHEAASQVRGIASIHVATDDERVGDAARQMGADVIDTPSTCANGTERVAAALHLLPAETEIIVNFQGDALLTPPAYVEALVAHMRHYPDCAVSTVAVPCTASAYRHLVDDQAAGRSGGTTVVVDAKGDAMYFSKRVIPFVPEDRLSDPLPVLMHLGLYAYRREALAHYVAAEPAPIETLEGLEQLRFLHHRVPMAVVRCEPAGWDSIELNNPSDLETIEAVLAARGIA